MPGRYLAVRRLVGVIATDSRAEKCVRCAIVVAGNNFRESRVLNSERCPDILIVDPGGSLIMRGRNSRMTARCLITQIDCVAGLSRRLAGIVQADAYRRVDQMASRTAGRRGTNRPGHAVI